MTEIAAYGIKKVVYSEMYSRSLRLSFRLAKTFGIELVQLDISKWLKQIK
jgi:deoxycytidylate deaminase